MGLRAPTETIKLSDGQSFTVRGLSYYDIRDISEKHGAGLALVWSKYLAGKSAEDMQSQKLLALGKVVLDTLPECVHDIVACVSGEDPEELKFMTFPVMTEALDKIMRLTLTSEDAGKKFLETVVEGAMATQKLTSSLTMPDGSGVFADR